GVRPALHPPPRGLRSAHPTRLIPPPRSGRSSPMARRLRTSTAISVLCLTSLTAAACGTHSGKSAADDAGAGKASGGAAFEISASTPKAKGPIASFTWSLYAEPSTLDYAQAFDYP